MANEEQLSILKQGAEVWNRWREENGQVQIDLQGADLRKTNLRAANLRGANFREANLFEADLTGANLSTANLHEANFVAAIFRQANLERANLCQANLIRANLEDANLLLADLKGAHLNAATLSGANLRQASLGGSDFSYLVSSYFSYAGSVGFTNFRQVDLSEAIGLEQVHHIAPSSISTDTLVLSKGKIPAAFLRGCGLSDWEVEMVKLYEPGLSNDERNRSLYKIYDLQATQALQISPLFISYSHADRGFVDRLEKSLTQRGIRFWRDTHEMKAGRLETQIDRGIRQNPSVLLVLSEHSLSSDWVEHEVRTARSLEKEVGHDVLCPVALDDSWKSSRWPARVMEQIMEYNILDFSEWRDNSRFEAMFRRLIDGLELFYKG